MKKLLLLVILLAVFLALDIASRRWAEDEIEDRGQEELRGVARVSADIDSFPFIARLVASGEVRSVEVRLDQVIEQGFRIDAVLVRLEGLTLDRGRTLRYDRVVVTDVDEAELRVRVAEDDLSEFLRLQVDLEPGRALVTVAGREVEVTIDVEDRVLSFEASGVRGLSVPLPSGDLVPCDVTGEVRDGYVELGCTTDHLPPALVTALGRATS